MAVKVSAPATANTAPKLVHLKSHKLGGKKYQHNIHAHTAMLSDMALMTSLYVYIATT